MQIMIRFLVVVAIMAGVTARWVMLGGEHLVPPSTLQRHDVLAEVASDPARGFCFSPAAAVGLGVGEDGQPGIAGWDDNRNGVVDDVHETGAVPSDDRCLAPTDPGYAELMAADGTVIISRGAFIACDDPQLATRWKSPHHGWLIKKVSGTFLAR